MPHVPAPVIGKLGAKGVPLRFLFILTLVFSSSSFSEEVLDCEKAWTTIDVNRCLSIDLSEAEKTMEKYLSKSLERHKDDSVSLTSIKESQEFWLNYRDAHCSSVFNIWRDGTVRTAMRLGCKIKSTHQRTTELWQSFLTYIDSTPPLLPKPEPYEQKEW
jgi:uncharacterized protein YecT (DUF1311 family)